MKILAFESSCDETSCAVIEDGRHILSDVISTQVPIHKKFGGVVPEIASRHHIEDVLPVAIEALEEAHLGWQDIDAIAVTQGPGLVGALVVLAAYAMLDAWKYAGLSTWLSGAGFARRVFLCRSRGLRMSGKGWCRLQDSNL